MTVDRKLTPDLGTDSYHADKYAYAVKRLSYRYNRMIFFSALAFIALIFCLSGFQYLSERSRELNAVGARIFERSSDLEQLLKSVSSQTGRMSLWADDYLGMGASVHRTSQLRRLLRQNAAGNSFDLDRLEPPYNRRNTGNIVGLGRLEGRDASFYAEMDMALDLFKLQSVVRELLPYIELSYYVSAHNFVSAFPWIVPPRLMKLSGPTMEAAFANLYKLELWESALPENNPGRLSYWTRAYPDPGQDKLIVTCGAPVYDGDHFLGVAAVDVSLGFIQGLVQYFGIGDGQLIVVDGSGQVLADSGWTGDSSHQIQPLSAVLPKGVAEKAQEIIQNAKDRSFVSGYNVFVKRLESTPWSLVYVLPEAKLIRQFLPTFGLYCGIMLGLAAFLIFTQVAITRQFVKPAMAVAEFIETEARYGVSAIPDVPTPWMAWFQSISDTFKLKQVEKHLRSFMESASGFVVYQLGFDPKVPDKSHVLFVSPSIREVMGIPEPYEFVTWFEKIHTEDRKRVTEVALNAMSEQRPFEEIFRIFHSGKNDWVWIQARSTPVFDSAGKLAYYNGLIVDVTERKKAEQELQNAHHNLEHRVKERTTELLLTNDKLSQEILERKRVEDELRFQKAYAEQLFDNLPDAIVALDNDDNVTKINPSFTKLFGYFVNEALGRRINDLIAPAESFQEAQGLSAAAMRGERIDIDVVRKRKDGSLVDLSLVGASITMDGSQTGFLGIYRDITDRKEAALALRQSVELYRTLVESIPYGITETDHAGNIVFVNSAQSRITGYRKDELIGSSVLSLLPSDFERKEFIGFGKSVLKDQPPPGSWFGQNVMRDGKIIDVQVDWNYRRDFQGALVGFVTITTDITARKQAEAALKESEEKYRLVVENASEGIAVIQGGAIKFANSRLEEIIGYCENELISMRLMDLVHLDDQGKINSFAQAVLEGGPVSGPMVIRIIAKDVSLRWIQVGAVRINWAGQPAILSFATDVTETKNLEDHLVKVEKLESIGVLAGGIAHDFNNLLTAILGNISLVQIGLAPDDKQYHRLREAEKACYRARDLTHQLLAFAKGGAPVKQTVSLEDLVRDTCEFCMRGTHSTSSISFPPDIWTVEADPGQLGQVFTNVCMNAGQAMPQGGVIHIMAENIVVGLGEGLPLQEGYYVRVSVQDHGIGIAPEYHSKIFDPYFTTKPQGSGLGLATAFAIIKNHGGLITLESQPGAGTTFHIYLPASKELVKATQEITRALESSLGKILIMDDEEAIRNLICDLLSMMGYQTQVSRDGGECIDLYKQALDSGQPFDVVILDLTVPGGMGGEEAIKRLREIDPAVKAIVSSGYSDAPIMSEHEKYGFREVIAKPYDVVELCRVLDRVFSLHQNEA